MDPTRERTDTHDATRHSSRLRDLALTSAFALFLLLPAIAAVTGIGEDTDLIEQRVLADRPGGPTDFEEWKAYPDRFESFFEDHFGLRKWLIYTHKKVLRKVWKKGRDDVLYGKGDWLYYSGFGILGDYRRTDPFRRSDLETWNAIASSACAQSKELGYALLWAVAPNKFSVYPEYAPAGIQPTGPVGRLDQFLDYFEEHSCLDILDLRPALETAKKDNLAYWSSDTHWTEVGAVFGLEAILRRIQSHVPETRVLSLEDFSVEEIEVMGGDLAKMLGMQEDYRETVPSAKLRAPARAKQIEQPAWCDALSPIERDQVLVFETGDENLPDAVVFHDSFGLALRDFLAECFRRVVFITTRQYRMDWVPHEKPDVVIRLFVERRLSERTPEGKRRGS